MVGTSTIHFHKIEEHNPVLLNRSLKYWIRPKPGARQMQSGSLSHLERQEARLALAVARPSTRGQSEGLTELLDMILACRQTSASNREERSSLWPQEDLLPSSDQGLHSIQSPYPFKVFPPLVPTGSKIIV